MHKIVFCTLALIAIAAPAPAPQEQHPTYILKQESNVSPDGYHFDFETSDGISRQEQGTLKQFGEDHRAIEVQGAYKYTAPDGLVYTVTYVADEHGFQPQEHVEHPGQHFETSDGISRQEQGTLKQFGEDHRAIEVQGAYKYTAPDGLVYTVTYVADEHGFQPQEHVEHPGQQ